jgi:hypothetical protein
MAKNGFKVFDSDMHLMEPPDLWQRYIDSDFRDRAPKGFQRWYADASVEIEGHFMPFGAGGLVRVCSRGKVRRL